ncbi:MAG: elongation factor P [Microscillaceae bacterium]|nr:elongation factor P [Microscillaceae bacterium]
MATTSDISKGIFLRINGELGIVTDYTYVTPNKTGAMYHVKLRNVKTGKAIEHRFRSGEKIDLERVETKELQFIYKEGNNLVVMDNESYEQSMLDEILLGDSIRFLKEGMNLVVSFDSDGIAIYAEMPNFVELEVTYTEPGLKGDTATNTLKPATMETGAEIRVPLFIDNGEIIRIDTRDGSYVERVKK